MFEVVSAGYCYSCSHKRDMAYCYTIHWPSLSLTVSLRSKTKFKKKFLGAHEIDHIAQEQ